MSRRFSWFLIVTSALATWGAVAAVTLPAQETPRYAGPTSDQGFLLPNGWTLKPAGQHIPLPDLPLNILPLADSRHVLAATSGYNAHELSLIDLLDKKVVDRQAVRQSWFGLADDAPSRQGVVVGRRQRCSPRVSAWPSTALTRTGGSEPERRNRAGGRSTHFRAGLAFDSGRDVLYSLDVDAGLILAIDPGSQKELRSAPAGTRPYDVVLAKNGSRIYVSDWAGRNVRALDPADLHTVAKIAVGEHPNQMAVHPKDDRLFVACASSDRVDVIDTRRGIVTEMIHTALFPRAPEGSTPDALAICARRKNALRGQRRQQLRCGFRHLRAESQPGEGIHSHGLVSHGGGRHARRQELLVGVGKGNQTKPNPIKREEAESSKIGRSTRSRQRRPLHFPYIGTTLSGSLSVVPIPDDKTLAQYTETVYKNCPYSDRLLSDAPYPEKTAIPTKVGEPSPIKHILYIIKENRTYDQVFGDLARGNGDPALVMFGRDVTPNHHKTGRRVRASGQPLL